MGNHDEEHRYMRLIRCPDCNADDIKELRVRASKKAFFMPFSTFVLLLIHHFLSLLSTTFFEYLLTAALVVLPHVHVWV